MIPEPSASSHLLQRIRRNVGILLTGGAISTALGIVTLGLNARGLGAADLGILALVQAYVIIMGRLFSFDTWQALVKFGGEVEKEPERLRALTSFALIFDAVSSLLAGLTGVGLLLLLGGHIGFPREYLLPVLFFTASLFIQLPGAPVGLMRLLDKFHWIATISVAEAGLKVAAAGVLFGFGSALHVYIYVYAAIQFVANLSRVCAAFYLMKQIGAGGMRLSSVRQLRPIASSFMRFSAGSWVTGTINVARLQGVLFAVSALLGPAGAAYYAVAQKIVSPIYYVADPLRQAIFPELSRLVARAQHSQVREVVKRMLAYTVPLALTISAASFFFGDAAIWLIAGPGYEDAYWVLVGLTVGSCIFLCMPALSSLVILYAGMRAYTLATAGAAAVWASLFTLPMLAWGVHGAGAGELIFMIAWLLANGIILRRATRSLADT